MSDPVSHPLLALVRERGLLDDLQFEEVTQEVQRSGKSISVCWSISASSTWIPAPDHGRAPRHRGRGSAVLDDGRGDPEGRAGLDREDLPFFPYALHGTTLQLALADPLNPTVLDELGFSITYEIVPVVTIPKAVQAAIDKHYGSTGDRAVPIRWPSSSRNSAPMPRSNGRRLPAAPAPTWSISPTTSRS